MLSVNLNKVALLRNSRGADNPGVVCAAESCIEAGARGLTVHWREDERHTRAQDVRDLWALAQRRGVELNLEGDLRPELIELGLELGVTQLTLVPVTPGEITSDHGWGLPADIDRLAPVIERVNRAGIRTAIFVDAVSKNMAYAAQTGAHRVEIYTEPYAAAFGTPAQDDALDAVRQTARAAVAAGLEVNAGHDLDLHNLPLLAREVPEIVETSIGHALIADALYLGLAGAVEAYLAAARGETVVAPRTR